MTLLYAADGAGTMNGDAVECDTLLIAGTVEVGKAGCTDCGDGGDGFRCERWCIRTLLLHSGTCTRITAVAMAVGFASLFRSYLCKFRGAIIVEDDAAATGELVGDAGATMSTEVALAMTPVELDGGLYELSGDINIVLGLLRIFWGT